MKILDKYIIKNFLFTFIFILFILTAISVVVDFTEKLEDFIDKKAPLQKIIFDYYFNFIPYINGILAPLFIFIAVIFFTSRLSNRSEVISILANGVSFRRFLMPYVACGLCLSILLWYANNYFIPNRNKTRVAFEEQYILNRFENKNRNIHFQISANEYVYVESFNSFDSIGYKFGYEKYNGKNLIYRLRADRIEWNTKTKNWKAIHCFVRNINNMHESIQEVSTLDINGIFTVADFTRGRLYKETMTTPEMWRFIQTEKQRGTGKLEVYELEAYTRSALAFSIIIFTLIGVAVSYRKVRGGMGLNLVIGFIISGLYVVMQQFAKTFTTNANLPAFWGVWIPNIFFMIVAIALLTYNSRK
jgi:lipopolysaccharide export system permease protein